MFRSVPEFDLDLADKDVRHAIQALAEAMSPANHKDFEGETQEIEKDEEENKKVSAGYTYLGQFIDHDITFDPASSMERLNDPEALVDFRTPRFDLDSVYGRGPADQPYMYEKPKTGPIRKFLAGTDIGLPSARAGDKAVVDSGKPDHPRMPGNGRAVIGDKRNDENVIVAQIHTVFTRFHNRLADECPDLSFDELQQSVRWHYQWIVLQDYLFKIVGKDMVRSILPHLAPGKGDIFIDKPDLKFYNWENDPFIPTEFSTAAFRFGHSMVRPVYRLNRNFQNLGAPPIKEKDTDKGEKSHGLGRRMLFNTNDKLGLNGFKPVPPGWTIEWDLYFQMDSTGKELTNGRLQPSYKVDTALVEPLANLPEFAAESDRFLRMLSFRNIMRGFAMRLPCGEDVARAMSIAPLEAEELRIGKAESQEAWAKAPMISTIGAGKDIPSPFLNRTPLWVYILAEGAKKALAGADHVLGEVGGRIVGETFIGMLLGDKRSFLHLDPRWKPWDFGGKPFDMATMIQYANGVVELNRKPQPAS